MNEPQVSLTITLVVLAPILLMAVVGSVWELRKWIKRKVSAGRPEDLDPTARP